jgi:large subunit ribosomal protein L35
MPEAKFCRLNADCQELNTFFEELMPKLKSHKGASKRFKKTATGKVKRGHAKLRHILTSKDKKSKRKLGKSALVSDGDLAKVLRMIPYQ